MFVLPKKDDMFRHVVFFGLRAAERHSAFHGLLFFREENAVRR